MSWTPRNREQLEFVTAEMAKQVGPTFEEAGACFVVIGAHFEGGWATYVSNGDRTDVIRVLRETADRLERGQMEPPTSLPPAGSA